MYIRSNCTSLSYEINNKKRTEQKNIAYDALLGLKKTAVGRRNTFFIFISINYI